METIEFLIRRVLMLIVVVVVAIVVAQNFGVILSVLIAALVILGIAKLGWPSPRR